MRIRLVRKATRRSTTTICALVVALLAAAVSSQAQQETPEEAVAAAEAWLKLVDRGEISQSWQTAADLFKRSITEEKWKAKIEAVRGPLGRRIFRKIELAKYETELPGAPEGEYVVIRIKGGFENQIEVTEVVTTVKEMDGKWRVVAYLIQ